MIDIDPVLQRIWKKLQEQHYTWKDLEKHLKIANGIATKWKHHGNKSYYKYIGEIAAFLRITPTYLLTGTVENFGDLTEEERDFIARFKAIDRRGQKCIIDLMDDFYKLSNVVRAMREEATASNCQK